MGKSRRRSSKTASGRALHCLRALTSDSELEEIFEEAENTALTSDSELEEIFEEAENTASTAESSKELEEIQNTALTAESSKELEEIFEVKQEPVEELQAGIEVQPQGGIELKAQDKSVELEESHEQLHETGRIENPPAASSEDIDSTLVRILKEQQQLHTADVEADSKQNKQDQDDEILALEAIYEGDFSLLPASDELSGPRSFVVRVPVEIPDCIQVLMGSSTASTSSAAPKAASYGFALEHLPPIVLACTYTSGYPSHEAPLFVLYSRWLTTEQLMQLSKRLGEIWFEQIGQVVLFAWIEFLHTQTLSTIGATETLALSPCTQTGSTSTQVLSHFTSPDAEALYLLRHDEEMQLQAFNQAFHTCDICLTDYAGKDFMRLTCEHFYCRICMQQYASLHIQDGTVNRLKCPDSDCGGSFPPRLLKELVGSEAFQRWETLSLQRTLDLMPDVVYCPRCLIACVEGSDHLAQCGACYFNFCSLCSQPLHIGQECSSPEARLRILQERLSGSKASEELRKERDMLNEILNLREVRRDAKQCPTCGMAISKTEGCNKMVCTNCGGKFCFQCGQAVDGYEHFDTSCELFDDEVREIQVWVPAMNPRQMVAQVAAEILGNLKPCPGCRQPNPKRSNNNHMFCWACQSHYCALCMKLVRRASEHFGPKKCKQHTPD